MRIEAHDPPSCHFAHDASGVAGYAAGMRRIIPHEMAVRIVYGNVIVAALFVSLGVAGLVRRHHRFDALLLAAGQQHQVDPRLISAVIWKESLYNPRASGAAQEVGLMQVMDGALTDWQRAHRRDDVSQEDLWDPSFNIEVGTWYLARAIRHWREAGCRDPLPFALAEYNAGRSRVRAWVKTGGKEADDFIAAIEFSSTRRYVRDILKRYRGRAS